MQGMLKSAWSELSTAISPAIETSSATRMRDESLRQANNTAAGPTEVLVVKQPVSVWQQRWQKLAAMYGSHPLFRRLHGAGQDMQSRGRDAAEDMRERWETSDSPLVHRVQDMSDSVFTETEMARGFREISIRDPSFDMPTFLSRIRADVPTVVGAYLVGDIDILKEHCAPDMLERLTAIIKAQQTQGQFTDPTLLDTSDVELVEIKMLDDHPVIVVRFNCQQINCTRDKFGNIVDGAADDVQRVFYLWALQQESSGFVTKEGHSFPPRWQLKEMLVHGMIPLIG